MPHYAATIQSRWPAERAFTYMADFSNASEWDPSVISATRLDSGPVHERSSFDLQIRSGRRVLPFRYEVTTLDTRLVQLRAQTPRFESIDTITVRDAGDGSEVCYEAYLSGRGVVRLANPLIGMAFRRLGDAARDRLSHVLNP